MTDLQPASQAVPQIVKPRARRITPQDAIAIADMVADRMTETEACSLLNIEPRRWFKWKNQSGKHGKFNALAERARAAKISGCFAQIRKAAEGQGGVRHDWRAADRLLAIAAPERYSQSAGQSANVQTGVLSPVVINTWLTIASEKCLTPGQAIETAAKVESLPAPEKVKMLPGPPSDK